MSEESDVEKTEDPTPQRKEKAREEGQIPRSKELTSLLMLLSGWSLIYIGGDSLVRNFTQLMHDELSFNHLLVTDTGTMLHRLYQLLTMMVTAILPLLMGLFICAIASSIVIGGLHFSGKSLKVDITRISPLSGFKRLFSIQVVSELIKSLMKSALVGCACALYLYKNKSHFIQLVDEPLSEALSDSRTMIAGCLLIVILALIPMVGYDVFYQIFSNMKKLRMSRQEIRDEHKQAEGDPHVKGRIRQLQRTMAQNRMMSDVPTADVIVNNPTHYSVAISWKEGNMSAPTVQAKGAGEVALRIRELGEEHKIPMLEAAPLARALYRHCEIGSQIPTDLYSAVAEVLAWVYSLRRWRQSGGIIPKKPENLPVPSALDFAQESQD